MKGRILVIRGGAIGDFIVTLPVLSALREAFPETELHVMGYPHIVQLAVEGKLAHSSKNIDSRAMAVFFAKDAQLDPELAAYFAQFAIIVSFLYDPDQIFRENIGRVSNAQFVQGIHRPDESKVIPASECFLDGLRSLAIFGTDSVPRLPIVGDRPSQTIALHPGSGSESKNWPETQWGHFLNLLVQQTSIPLLLVGGEAEGNRLEKLASLIPADRRHVARSLPLSELARKLKGCRLFVGHDSGIMHMAAALGVEGVVLWGPSSLAIWGPLSPKMKVLSHPAGLRFITVDQVFEAVRNLLEA